jgi:hypothetical protein
MFQGPVATCRTWSRSACHYCRSPRNETEGRRSAETRSRGLQITCRASVRDLSGTARCTSTHHASSCIIHALRMSLAHDPARTSTKAVSCRRTWPRPSCTFSLCRLELRRSSSGPQHAPTLGGWEKAPSGCILALPSTLTVSDYSTFADGIRTGWCSTFIVV